MNMRSVAYQDYAVHIYKSKKLFEAFRLKYNFNKPLRDQLRPAHLNLVKQLIVLYRDVIKNEQAYGNKLAEGKAFPTLRTNNKQLHKLTGISVRTIIELRGRLKAAGVIKREIWHGTNSSYEIELNPQFLHLQRTGRPENIIHKFQEGYQAPQQSEHEIPADPQISRMTRSSHHSVTSKKKLITNKLIELSGADSQHGAEDQSVTSDLGVSKCGKPVENRENSVENPQRKGEPEQKEPKTGIAGSEKAKRARGTTENPPSCGAPPIDEPFIPESAPDTVDQALARLPAEQARKIQGHLTVIWTCANLNLYADKWINEAESERGLARLAEYFCYSHAKGWPGGAAEIIERILLVRRWIQGGEDAGQKRWVPLPSDYFDIRNPHGFRATKKWFKDHMQAKREIKNGELLTKAIKEYTRSFDPEAKYGPSEAYRRISQRLGKRDRSLLEKFQQQIDDYAKSRASEETA